jgi:hypothetical protein
MQGVWASIAQCIYIRQYVRTAACLLFKPPAGAVMMLLLDARKLIDCRAMSVMGSTEVLLHRSSADCLTPFPSGPLA